MTNTFLSCPKDIVFRLDYKKIEHRSQRLVRAWNSIPNFSVPNIKRGNSIGVCVVIINSTRDTYLKQ